MALPALTILLVIAYSLPWLVGAGASLTFNGYDLAEWLSLYPLVRAESPSLLTTLLLRLPLVLIGLIAIVSSRLRWFQMLIIIVIALALMPSLDFFVTSSDDSNYRQQFALSLSVVVGGVVAAFISRSAHQRLFCVLVSVVGAAVALAGLLRACDVVSLTDSRASIGPGGLLVAAFFLVISVVGALTRFGQ